MHRNGMHIILTTFLETEDVYKRQVGAATQGLSNYLNKNFKDLDQISVVVGHDCRNNSRLFAEISANIFSANGIKVYLFEDMRPTPEMSFATSNTSRYWRPPK